MTLAEAYEYVATSHEMESEQRAEYGSGAVSLGLDPYDWAPAFDGYRAAADPYYHAARVLTDADAALQRARAQRRLPAVDAADDLPF